MEKEKKRKSEREKERKKIEKEKGKKNGEKRKRKGGGRVSVRRRWLRGAWQGAWARGGARDRVRGPGEAAARAAGDNCGRRSHVGDRLPIRAGWDGGEERERERERGTVGEKERMETTNGIGCWKSGVRDREKILGIRVQGFRRILSSTMKRIFKNIFLACDLFWWIFFWGVTPSLQCISIALQAQEVPFSTQTLLGPSKSVKRYLGTQIALMLVRGELITLIAQVPTWSFLSLVKS